MKKQYGFSVIELMVASALGLVILAGVTQILVGSQASYNELVQQSRMQETAKIAMDYIVRDLRNVGYWGCNGAAIQVANSIEQGGFGYFDIDDTLKSWIDGEVNIPADYDKIVPDSHVVEMRVINIEGALTVVDHNPSAATIGVNGKLTTPSGTIWAIVDRDCSNIGIFAQTGSPTVNGNITKINHNKGSGANGTYASNCTKDLKGDFDCTNHNTNALTEAYSEGSSTFTIQHIAYSIEPSGSNNEINSLHRKTLDIANDAEELIDGVDGLRFRFGIDDNGDGAVDLFMNAKALNESPNYGFNQVISIAIEIDVSSYEDLGFQSQTFTTSVRLRNRGLS